LFQIRLHCLVGLVSQCREKRPATVPVSSVS